MTATQEKLIGLLNTVLILGICAMALVGCQPVTQQQANTANADVQALCGKAMGLAPLAGPMSVDIIAACGTASVVADLATQPGAVAYLNQIIAKIPH